MTIGGDDGDADLDIQAIDLYSHTAYPVATISSLREPLDVLTPSPVLPLQGRTPTPAAGEPSGAMGSSVAGAAIDRAAPTADGAATGIPVDVWITFYTCPTYCGAMANGEIVYGGAAACGGFLALGQRFQIEHDPTGRVYVCADRGLGGWYWIDIFWADSSAARLWLAEVGSYGTVMVQ